MLNICIYIYLRENKAVAIHVDNNSTCQVVQPTCTNSQIQKKLFQQPIGKRTKLLL